MGGEILERIKNRVAVQLISMEDMIRFDGMLSGLCAGRLRVSTYQSHITKISTCR